MEGVGDAEVDLVEGIGAAEAVAFVADGEHDAGVVEGDEGFPGAGAVGEAEQAGPFGAFDVFVGGEAGDAGDGRVVAGVDVADAAFESEAVGDDPVGAVFPDEDLGVGSVGAQPDIGVAGDEAGVVDVKGVGEPGVIDRGGEADGAFERFGIPFEAEAVGVGAFLAQAGGVADADGAADVGVFIVGTGGVEAGGVAGAENEVVGGFVAEGETRGVDGAIHVFVFVCAEAGNNLEVA